MTQYRDNEDSAPALEQLVAYVDGNLDEAAREQVERWLHAHPQAAAEMEGHRAVARLTREAGVPEPKAGVWALVLARIEAALAGGTATVLPAREAGPARARGRYRRASLAVAAVAAAVVLGVIVLGPARLGQKTAPSAVEPWPVATAADVEIISLDAADLKALVVGQPPLREPLVLAAAGDVELENVEPDPTDGMVPRLRVETQGLTVPMIVAPLDLGPVKNP